MDENGANSIFLLFFCIVFLASFIFLDKQGVAFLFWSNKIIIAAGSHPAGSIPDLMVKFNRVAVQSILQVGEKIKITITGNLTDGRSFEGTDFVRVISP